MERERLWICLTAHYHVYCVTGRTDNDSVAAAASGGTLYYETSSEQPPWLWPGGNVFLGR